MPRILSPSRASHWLVLLLTLSTDMFMTTTLAAAEAPGRVVDRYLSVYTGGDPEKLLDLYADDLEFVDVSQRHKVGGREAMRAQLQQLKIMHKAMAVEEKRRATTGNLVTVEVVYSGTLDCAAFGAPDHGDLSYSLPAVLLFEVEDGQIRRQTDYLDFRTLMELQESLRSPPADE